MATSTKVVHQVVDLGEDSEAWAIAAHVDDETALRSVIVHLWELGVLRDSLDWSDLRIGTVGVVTKSGRWVYDDEHDEGRWEDDPAGEPWTFITT